MTLEVFQSCRVASFSGKLVGPFAELLKKSRDFEIPEMREPGVRDLAAGIGVVRYRDLFVRSKRHRIATCVRQRPIVKRPECCRRPSWGAGTPHELLTVVPVTWVAIGIEYHVLHRAG